MVGLSRATVRHREVVEILICYVVLLNKSVSLRKFHNMPCVAASGRDVQSLAQKDPPDSDLALEACSLFTSIGLRSLHSLETDNSTLARKDPPASNLLLLRPAHCSLALV
ncbi:hypothetical protein J6590_040181 [Homalodisca vitripennis]|nr:hypothetical protein J6590_040181 [Homalodisca vitripennis]